MWPVASIRTSIFSSLIRSAARLSDNSRQGYKAVGEVLKMQRARAGSSVGREKRQMKAASVELLEERLQKLCDCMGA